ncbi:MAG: bifunctional isocitrate dehydrogenase kinase/phosphatase [Chloroflexi bacterium]|nr:bifunctional isocitrate dehydrogenase kinase/phosphatase [Chloroflexota bacterium]
MKPRLTHSRIANLGARAIHGAFDAYHAQFKAITRRAQTRFERRDWQGLRADAGERLDLYRRTVDPTVWRIRDLLGDLVEDKLVWAGMKAVYSGLIADRDDWELAETFFNSITRRIFATVGVDATIEFVDTDFDTPPTQPKQPVYRVYHQPASLLHLAKTILSDYRHRVPYDDSERDAELMAAEIATRLESLGAPPVVDRAELAAPVFYRNKGAYLTGRLFSGRHRVPLAIALLNLPQGILVDAVLLDEDAISIVFSFAHSYFHVEVERSYDLVQFLKSLMPRKRVAELYISIGQHKHGKTELYRDLLNSLASSSDRFETAPGERGMVMEVFTLPRYDLVVKIIKDHFAEPKNTSRQAVVQKYHLVFGHDRAGRLVDAQEFEHLRFERSLFSPELLDELQRVAANTVSVADDCVTIKHAYIERRVTPLNIYLREAEWEAARAAAVDYGNAIKDLAGSNIFPGDLLLKNFGVTRHGRVVFYDYDELCLLTDCQFSPMPQPRDEVEEFASEPWFYVGDNEIFPEEFRAFLRLPGDLDAVFTRHHADLFEVRFWSQVQERLRAGEVMDIFPYAQRKRLPRKWNNRVDGQV